MGSKEDDPLINQKHFDFPIENKYYNAKIHQVCFGLPEFMENRINEELEKGEKNEC